MGGSVSGLSAARGASATANASSSFAGASENNNNNNNILPTNMDPSEQDNSNYGYTSMVGQSHNGTGGESY